MIYVETYIFFVTLQKNNCIIRNRMLHLCAKVHK